MYRTKNGPGYRYNEVDAGVVQTKALALDLYHWARVQHKANVPYIAPQLDTGPQRPLGRDIYTSRRC